MKPKTCRYCKDKFNPMNTMQVVCSPRCAISYIRDKDAAKIKKQNAKQKREFRDNDIKLRKAAAKKACHAYIRARDKDQACICCGRPLGKNFDAGHFYESGNNPLLRYHEDNIHAQSVYCNQYQGGDSDDYPGRLLVKIGQERFDHLKANKGGTIKRTCQDYKEIETHYKQKLRELESEQ